MLRSLFYFTGFVTQGYIEQKDTVKFIEPMYQNKLLQEMIKEASKWHQEKKTYSIQWD